MPEFSSASLLFRARQGFTSDALKLRDSNSSKSFPSVLFFPGLSRWRALQWGTRASCPTTHPWASR